MTVDVPIKCGWPNPRCDKDATRLVAYNEGQAFYRVPYCNEHAQQLREQPSLAILEDRPLE